MYKYNYSWHIYTHSYGILHAQSWYKFLYDGRCSTKKLYIKQILRKRLNGDIGILHKHVFVKLNSLKHKSRYAQNQNIQGTKRFGGIWYRFGRDIYTCTRCCYFIAWFSFFFKTIIFYNGSVVSRTRFRCSGSCRVCEIDIMQSKAFRITTCPFKVVHQRPRRIPTNVYSI